MLYLTEYGKMKKLMKIWGLYIGIFLVITLMFSIILPTQHSYVWSTLKFPMLFR